MPVADRPAVSLGHVESRYLSDRESSDRLVLGAHPRRLGFEGPATIGDDHDLGPSGDLVAPAVEDAFGGDADREFLADFPHQAGGRILAMLQLASRQLPLVPFVAQQDDASIEEDDALDRDREAGRRCSRGRRQAQAASAAILRDFSTASSMVPTM